MHIPLPKSGDLQSLEAFRDGLKELNERAESHFAAIFGGRHGGGFLWVSEQHSKIKGSDDAVKLKVHIYHPHSGRNICEFSWRTNGKCDKLVCSERDPLAGSSLMGADWRRGAVLFLETVSAHLHGIPAALAGLERLSKGVESYLEEVRRCG